MVRTVEKYIHKVDKSLIPICNIEVLTLPQLRANDMEFAIIGIT